ncbi:MAG: flavin reductase family protein [Candidatus Nanopelagicales bacterium]
MPEPTPERFRRAASRYATGIAVVTTVADGIDHAMTANSFTTVSLDPLLALVCVERDSRFHEAVLAAGRWAVSFLPAGPQAEDTARWFAKRGRPLAGQFDRFAHRRGADGCLILSDALASLELRTVQVVPAGDHDVLIGLVTQVHDPAVDCDPTVYYSSKFRELASLSTPDRLRSDS